MFIEEKTKVCAITNDGKTYSGFVYKIVIQPCVDDDNRPHALMFISQTENHHNEDDSDFGCIALWVDKLKHITVNDSDC